jgi:hypothetical protein
VGINAAALDPSRVVDATHRAQLPERINSHCDTAAVPAAPAGGRRAGLGA